MFCPRCGARVGDTDRFCPGCGTNLFETTGTATYKTGRQRGTRPVSDVRLPSFLLGLILGLIGLVIALVIYSNGNEFEESPTGTVILWCIFGMFFWFIVLAAIAVMILGVSLTM